MSESSLQDTPHHAPITLYQGHENSDKINEWQLHEQEVRQQKQQTKDSYQKPRP
jgi:hypothetical protein